MISECADELVYVDATTDHVAQIYVAGEQMLSGDRFSLRQLRYLATKAHGFFEVALNKGGDTVGYVVCLYNDRHAIARNYLIGVMPQFQGKGYGELLLREFMQRASADGYHIMTAEVRKDNVRSLGLHEKLGFIRVRTLPKYYFDGMDGWKLCYMNIL